MNKEKIKTPAERNNLDLLQLTLELYARSNNQPHNEKMHNFAQEAIEELKKRLQPNSCSPTTKEQIINFALEAVIRHTASVGGNKFQIDTNKWGTIDELYDECIKSQSETSKETK